MAESFAANCVGINALVLAIFAMLMIFNNKDNGVQLTNTTIIESIKAMQMDNIEVKNDKSDNHTIIDDIHVFNETFLQIQVPVNVSSQLKPKMESKKANPVNVRPPRKRKEQPFANLYISDNPYYLDDNIVIVGQVRNARKTIRSLLNQLLRVSCLYNSTTFILFISNSKDDTIAYLEQFLNESDINCTQLMFAPKHIELYKKYDHIKTLEEVINIFSSNDTYDIIMYNLLTNYSKYTKTTAIDDIDMKEIAYLLDEKLRIHLGNKTNDIAIEEIIYEKLSVIKYIKYHNKIPNSNHNVYKYLISGDEVVENELQRESNVLSQLYSNNNTNIQLSRVERFIIYRNMLLQQSMTKSNELHINFDYVMVLDLDIFTIDFKTWLNELYYTPKDINGICVDGIDYQGFTRDTFALVKWNGEWLQNGSKEEIMHKRLLIPNQQPHSRFYKVKSCFGGGALYKNNMNYLFNSQCKYTFMRDIGYEIYNDTNTRAYTHEWWLKNRYHNKYSEQSILELESFGKVVKREICEHIPFHYCLHDYGLKFAISSRAKLYYGPMRNLNRNSEFWKYYLKHRPNFTM